MIGGTCCLPYGGRGISIKFDSVAVALTTAPLSVALSCADVITGRLGFLDPPIRATDLIERRRAGYGDFEDASIRKHRGKLTSGGGWDDRRRG